MLETFGRRCQIVLFTKLGPNRGMWTDEHTFPTLNTKIRFPHRNLLRDVALLPLRGADRIGAINREGANRQLIAPSRNDLGSDVLYKCRCTYGHRPWQIARVAGFGWNRDLMQMFECGIDRRKILAYDRLSTFSVSLAYGFLDSVDRFIGLEHSADRKEAGLHDGIDAIAELLFLSHSIGIDGVDLDAFLNDLLLDRARQLIPNLCG